MSPADFTALASIVLCTVGCITSFCPFESLDLSVALDYTVRVGRNECAAVIYVTGRSENRLPTSMSLQNLKICDLRPSFLTLLSQLRCLDLSHNMLQRFSPKKFLPAKKLKMLSVSNNAISELITEPNSELGLEILDLSNNQLTSIRRGHFQSFASLRALQLSHNQISVVQEGSFDKLPLLEYLYLDGNPIASLGNTLLPLPQLTCINVSHTALESFPNTSNSVKVLSINDARISSIHPYSINKLRDLDTLEIEGNPWNCTCGLLDALLQVKHNIFNSSSTFCHHTLTLELISLSTADRFLNCSNQGSNLMSFGFGDVELDRTSDINYDAIHENGLKLVLKIIGSPISVKTFVMSLAGGIAIATSLMGLYILCSEAKKCRRSKVSPENDLEADLDRINGDLLQLNLPQLRFEHAVSEEIRQYLDSVRFGGQGEIHYARPATADNAVPPSHQSTASDYGSMTRCLAFG